MNAPEREFYSTRCLISHRPPFRTQEPLFYRCPTCGSVMVADRMPGEQAVPSLSCCGQALHPLEVCQEEEILCTHRLDYVVFGGFERSGARIRIDGGSHPMWEEHRIEWVYLRTFQGGQMKYLPAKTRSQVNFCFGDEDAYVYCDRPVCRMGREHCQFECKRGMTVYAYCNVHGLIRMVLQGKD